MQAKHRNVYNNICYRIRKSNLSKEFLLYSSVKNPIYIVNLDLMLKSSVWTARVFIINAVIHFPRY